MLLNLQFDSSGCMDTRITNLGGVSFKEASPLFNDNARCATFTPYDEDAGLLIDDNSIKTNLASTKEFTIYFKYKIDSKYLSTEYDTPILTTLDRTIGYCDPIISIKDKEYFVFYFNTLDFYTTNRVPWSFDNKWHTFCATKTTDNILYLFIDGEMQGAPYSVSSSTLTLTDQLFIGYYIDSYANIKTYSGSLDNFCLLDYPVYTESFVPPTLYFTGVDTENNYYLNCESNVDVSDEVKLEIEKQIRYGTKYFNDNQLDYLPRRCKITWQQEISYFEDSETINITRLHNRDDTIIDITGMEFEMSFYSNDNYNLTGNVLRLYKDKQIDQLFMLFIDKCFIPLSKIDIQRCDGYTTLFIKGRNPDSNEPIESLELVTIPFPCIYEENLGQRTDINPQYCFDKKGKFNPSSADYFYYIDVDRCAMMNGGKSSVVCTPTIQEESYTNEYSEDNNKSSQYIQYVWRYGSFETKYINGTSAYMYFMAWDHGYVKPGDKVILYKNTLIVDPSRYRIVSNDLIEFYNYKSIKFKDTDIFTMQVITDNSFDGQLYQDLTNTRFAWVTATKDNQSKFTIPTVEEGGFKYHKFLLFRGSVCMENNLRYEINEDDNTIRFLDYNDYVPLGTSLLFIFIGLNRADAVGPLHVKPIYYYTHVDRINNVTTIPLPYDSTYGDFKFSMSNTMVFIQNTFISPQRYKIDDYNITFVQSNDLIKKTKSVTLVCLKMVNELEDPTSKKNKVKKEQLEKGRRFILYDLGIDKTHKITLDNFVCFDQNGEYIPDLMGKIYNRNIVKYLQTTAPVSRFPTYLTCVYYSDSLENKANSIYPANDTYVKDYIQMVEGFYEMDANFDQFMEDFNYHHRQDLQYGENLANALNYIGVYNQNRLDWVYEKNAECDRVEINASDMLNNLKKAAKDNDQSYSMEILVNDMFTDDYYKDYCIFFVNGEYALWNKYTTYSGNKATIKLYVLPKATDHIEMIRFKKLNNFLQQLDSVVTKNAQGDTVKNIPAKIRVGKYYEMSFNATLTVIEYYNMEFGAKINVVRRQYDKIKNSYEKYLFSGSITVPTWKNFDLFKGKIYVPDIKDGVQDPGSVTLGPNAPKEYYEIYAKINARK